MFREVVGKPKVGKYPVTGRSNPGKVGYGKPNIICADNCKLGSISPTFYEQLLRAQIPKAQKRQSS